LGTTADPDLLTLLVAGVRSRGLAVFEGVPVLPTDDEDRILIPIVDWGADWEAFLDRAIHASVTFVYVSGTVFRRDDELVDRIGGGISKPRVPSQVFDETAIEGMAETEDELDSNSETESNKWLLMRLRERTVEWASYDGAITEIWCLWFCDGVAHRFFFQNEWFLRFEEALERAFGEASQVGNEDQRLRRMEDSKRFHERAREMARNSRFPEAKSAEKRRYMADQLFPEEQEWVRRQIAERAALVYWWEVAPVERTTQVEKIRALYDAGEPMTAIAAILRTSLAKVRAAISDSASD